MKNFKTNKDIVLIVDGFNIFIRSFLSSPLQNSIGNHIGGTVGFFRTINYLVNELNPSSVIVVWDNTRRKKKRKSFYQDYKNNRKVLASILNVKGYTFKSTKHKDESISEQLDLIQLLLKLSPFQNLTLEGLEGDDIYSILLKNKNITENKMCVIVSADKDLVQFVESEKIVWLTPYKWKCFHYDSIDMTDIDTIPPKIVPLYKSITGDASDNIKGVPGIGQQRFKELRSLLQLKSIITKDDLESFFSLIEIKEFDSKKFVTMKNKILENKDIIKRNFTLVNLINNDFVTDIESETIMNDLRHQLEKDKFKEYFFSSVFQTNTSTTFPLAYNDIFKKYKKVENHNKIILKTFS